jgi:DNA-binding transcriptional LysR family regulator
MRLLRVFLAVVRNRGFAAAEADLGVAPATISNHMASLESRLGVRLCDRGRGGFSLTPAGERIHEAALNLLRSAENFSSIVGSVRGELTGAVHFATVDAMHSNGDLGLSQALGAFAKAAPGVTLHADMASPHDLRQRLLDGRYQLILTPLDEAHPSIAMTHLFEETQSLYCGREHPLFQIPETALQERLKEGHRYAARAYATEREGATREALRVSAMTSSMESLALLILSGAFLGHLPSHYAASWVEAGQMRCLLATRLSYVDSFHLALLASEQNRAVLLLRDCIAHACSARRR